MRKLLLIDCCIRKEESRTKRIMDAFLSAVPDDCAVEHLVLTEENLAPLTGDFFAQRQRLLENHDYTHPRFRYAKQFAAADIIVIAAPFWDLAFPALLKIYIEQVSLDGITFGADETGLVGLCRATDMVFLTARGGFYTGDALEMGSRYLDALHTFFGIGRYRCIAADGMDVAGFDAKAALEKACAEARALAEGI